VAAIKQHTQIPVAVGFGIRTPEQAARIGRFADAVVVGSALVDCIHKAETPEAGTEAVLALTADLAGAVRRARN